LLALREASAIQRLCSWPWWRDVILPAMFSHDVIGALPARFSRVVALGTGDMAMFVATLNPLPSRSLSRLAERRFPD
jgi:hypothetical protein